jgi:DNA modification methylase
VKIECLNDDVVFITRLKSHPKNRNKHPEEQIKRLADILKYQGWRYPVKVSKRSGYVTSGHGRIEAAKLNGWDQVPVNYQDYESEEQEYADVIADNAIANWSELDLASINADLPDLGPDFDIDLLGIEDFTLDMADKEGLCDEDEVPETPKEATTRLGDLFALGEHRLLCGDSTKKEDVERLMGGEKADMVFTDPPYGVSYTEKNEFLNSLGKPMSVTKAIENDSKTIPEMFDLWSAVFNLTAEASHDKASYYICSPQGGELMMMMMQAIDQSPWSLKHTLIWNKNNHVLGRCDYHYKHEPILYGWKKKGTHEFHGNGTQTKSVWDIAKPHNSDLHPTMKPVELMENAIKNSSRASEKILDLFLGSGSTLIACEKTNRRCFGMEIDPHYCDVIIARWEKFTGKKAVKLGDA